jgi:neuropeptide S receptor 1
VFELIIVFIIARSYAEPCMYVCMYVCMCDRNKETYYFLIVLFKLTDLSVGLISVLTDIVWRATVAWYAGNAACKIIKFLQVSCYFY